MRDGLLPQGVCCERWSVTTRSVCHHVKCVVCCLLPCEVLVGGISVVTESRFVDVFGKGVCFWRSDLNWLKTHTKVDM